MAKGKGGFIGQDGLNAPDEPTGVSGTAGNTQVSVSFTAPSDVGGSAITGYRVQSNNALSFSGSYANKSFNVSSQAGAAGGVQFKSDGTKMYVTGQTSDKTFQYSLSTAYDVSTASYDSVELNHASQVSNANPYDLFFKTDGTKLYVIFGINDTVYQYSLSSAWDLSTASYDSVNFSVASQESGEPQGLAFSDDGTKMYVCGEGQATVFQYTLSTAWDLSSASYSSKSLDVSAQGTKPSGLAFALSGKVMLVSEESAVSVDVYYLGTAFDVTTASYNYSFDVSSQDPRPWYVALADSDTKMYVGGPNNDTVYQYTVSFSEESTYGASGSSSPITVTGLTNDTAYTFNVWAINAFGYSAPSDASGSVTPVAPGPQPNRGLFAIGYYFGYTNTIDYVDLSSTGNTSDFGDLTVTGESGGAVASTTRAVFGGRYNGSLQNTIDYVTIASVGNATDFGDMNVSKRRYGACSSDTRGLFGGGNDGTHTNAIEYITIASTGNGTDFGDCTELKQSNGSCSSTTRGLFAGGFQGSTDSNVIDYITIASTGNASDFGDLTEARQPIGASSNTRGLFIAGYSNPLSSYRATIDYITIASTGNATDFGDQSAAGSRTMATSNGTNAVFNLNSSGTHTNTLEYVVIATTGNSSDFGDLTVTSRNGYATSGSHGGLS